MKKLLIFTLFCLSTTLYSQVKLETLDDIAEYGIENNLDYKKALLSLWEAEDSIQGILTVDETKLSATVEYDDGLDLSTSLSIPIIEQFTIDADIDDDMSGDIEFSLSPFSGSTDSKDSELEYSTAMINYRSALLSAEYNSLVNVLNWMTDTRKYISYGDEMNLMELQYRDDKERYNLGNITLDELKDSLVDWSESRKTYITAEQSLSSSKRDMYETLSTVESQLEIRHLTLEELESALNKLKAEIDPEQGDYLKSSDLKLSTIDAESASVDLNSIWYYDPDISADLTLPYSSDGINSDDFSASVTFSIELDDFKFSERAQAKENNNIYLHESILKEAEVKSDFMELLSSIESSEINSEIYTIEYEEAKLLYEEALLLYKAGDYSELELEESRIYMQQCEDNLFESLVSEYSVWLELKEYLI